MLARSLIISVFAIALAAPAWAVDEKIDPTNYICAELVASSVDGVPPIYEGLQLDGYAAAKKNQPVADAEILQPLLLAVSDYCSARPADKALAHWQKMRENFAIEEDGPWRADKTTCGDYEANPDDGSGFIIWADAYYRGKSGKNTSVLADQKTLDNFLAVCKKNPKRLVLDVIAENGK